MAMEPSLVAAADCIFSAAGSYKVLLPRPVDPQHLHEVYVLCKWGPTSKNSNPARGGLLLKKPAWSFSEAIHRHEKEQA